MNTIKLYESFNNNEVPEFSQKISNDDVYLSLYKEPGNLRSGMIRSGVVNWTIDLTYKKWGIDIGSVSLLYIEFELELDDEEDEDGGTIMKTITVTKEELQEANEDLKQEVEGLPIAITDLEIDMRHSESPQDWKYKLVLGKKPE
jgi:hypothetical protein